VRGFQGILVLPQKPYLTEGTLREQVCMVSFVVDGLLFTAEC
jgi:ABC-type uncharacterized transport system fused permease/ATPase subunit